MPESEWTYAGHLKDGTLKLRRDTGEALGDVLAALDARCIKYEAVPAASMIRIYGDRVYYYYYTTGRWGTGGPHAGRMKYYQAKSITEFLTRWYKSGGLWDCKA